MVKKFIAVNSEVVQGMHAAIGACKHDTEGGCIDVWNRTRGLHPIPNHLIGYDNFYIELAKYAPKLSELHLTIIKDEDLYDGVFCMDVSEKFGSWFAKYVIKHTEPPTKKVANDKINKLMKKFLNA